MIEVLDVWRGFWTTAIVLAGTLLGFLFVAAALRAREFFGEDRRLRVLLYQTVTAYSAVAMIGLLILMPMLSQRRLGLVIAGVGTLLVLASSWRMIFGPKERGALFGPLPASLCEVAAWVSYVMITWAGYKLMRGVVHAIDWIALAVWVLLASALSMSVQLLRKSTA
jgi:hypothetical protein